MIIRVSQKKNDYKKRNFYLENVLSLCLRANALRAIRCSTNHLDVKVGVKFCKARRVKISLTGFEPN